MGYLSFDILLQNLGSEMVGRKSGIHRFSIFLSKKKLLERIQVKMNTQIYLSDVSIVNFQKELHPIIFPFQTHCTPQAFEISC